ncbi:MAG TPA: tRNA lysidine(34) synthetase TilS [Pseudonocardia sp.]|nr:tRNA lysidine(34) synthetase TilS [Pseudonocardia sp.]
MSGVESAVAEVRRAVRSALTGLPAAARVAPPVVACSGGADSLALVVATLEVTGGPVHAAVVDHALQDGSAERTAATVELLAGLGALARGYPVEVSGPGGVEAAARRARYAALLAARPDPDSPVLLGHTLDDQAETVLLGLGRGSGPRSLAGMATWNPPWLRPLLGVRRAVTRAACAARGLSVWDDPHNADPRFTRARLRHEVLPLLEEVLAGGVAEALARTAAQLREDTEVLDALAADLLADALVTGTGEEAGLRVSPLAAAHPAVRRRALREWLRVEGVTTLTDAHLRAADLLAAPGPDRSGVALPGGLELMRGHGRLTLRPARWSTASPLPREDGHRVRR